MIIIILLIIITLLIVFSCLKVASDYDESNIYRDKQQYEYKNKDHQ